jgi:Transposase DDE domain group 1
LFPGDPDLKKDAAAFVENSVWYCSLDYQTLDSWSRSRRVVVKVDYSYEEKAAFRGKLPPKTCRVDTRFVVTSLPIKKIPPGQLYTQKYCESSRRCRLPSRRTGEPGGPARQYGKSSERTKIRFK